MIEEVPGRPDGVLEFMVSGRVASGDYDAVLTPAIERALQEHDRIRVLIQFAPDFEGYSLDAAWSDTRLGLRHWRGFERIAVVTDIGWLGTAVKAMAFAMPCPVQTFGLAELEDARRWLGEALGTIHLRELGGDALMIQMIGTLDADVYDRIGEDLETFIATHGRIRLLVDLRQFDGWEGISAMSQHMSLMRDHYRAPKRVAILGEAAWQHVAQRVFSRFFDAEVRYFQGADLEDVEAWLKQE